MALSPPKSWEDVEIFLEDGGYTNRFRAREYEQPGREPVQDESFMIHVAATIIPNQERADWLRAWIKIALIPYTSLDDTLRMFFEMAWHLYRRNFSEAEKVLERCRKGGVPFPDSSSHTGDSTEEYPSTIAGKNGIGDFTGIPSGLHNQWGMRSDSPLSSILDQDERDNDGHEFARKHQDVFSSVPPGLLTAAGKRSDGPLSSIPDNLVDVQSVEEVIEPRRKQSRFEFRPLERFNYQETADIEPEIDRYPPSVAEQEIVPESESDLERGEVITVKPPKKHSQTILAKRKSPLGRVAKKSRVRHKGKTLDSGVLNANQTSAHIRKSPRNISSKQQQQGTGAPPTQKPEGQRQLLCRDGPNFLSPIVQSPRDVRAGIRADQKSLAEQSNSRTTSSVRKSDRLKEKALSEKKKPGQGKKMTSKGTTTYSKGKNIQLGRRVPRTKLLTNSPKCIKKMKARNGLRSSQTKKGPEPDLDSAKSGPTRKRHYSEVAQGTPESPNDTQCPEEPPFKKALINGEASVVETEITFQGIESIADSPIPSSPVLASDPPSQPNASDQSVDDLAASLNAACLSISLSSAACFERADSCSRSMSLDSNMEIGPFQNPSLMTPTATRTVTLDDTPESSQSTLVEFSPPEGLFPYVEPPWRRSLDHPSSPNSARGPGELDTHSWRIPRVKLRLYPPPQPPMCFPHQASRTGVERQTTKQSLPMKPPVWAQSRQELCESLPYFRSYQGGVYSRGKKALGYLLDGHPAAQDIWHAEGKLIISHAGGNSAVDKDTRQTMLINDQTMSSVSCSALHNSFKCRQPIVLIAGNEYNLFPYDLEHRSYVVLGCYLITQAWEEPEPSSTSPRGYFVRWKFLFQWIEAQGEPWWIQNPTSSETSTTAWAISTITSSPQEIDVTFIFTFRRLHQSLLHVDPRAEDSISCSTCNAPSPKIYNFGWVCTYSTCASFFRRKDGGIQDQEGYCPNFLIPHGDPANYEANRLQIRPGPPVKLEHHGDRQTTTRRFWKGFWCENCGRLSCREHWTYWECYNCHEKLIVKHRLRSPGDGTLPVGQIKFQIGENSGIEPRPLPKLQAGTDLLKCRAFKLPWNRGIIYLIEGNPVANEIADKIFLQYQKDAEDPAFFRRYCMKSHKLKGRMLSHYFSQNSGEPYKYVGGTDNTVSLDKYSSVQQAISVIRERAAVVLGEDPSFNEILSAAYMDDQKMEFHSDGEKDLGPVVASLSLGAPATMKFRAVPTRVKHDTSQASDTNVRKTPPIALTLTLRHGDVLVMAGAEIQEYYQHAVHPSGFRIAATARYIKQEGPQIFMD